MKSQVPAVRGLRPRLRRSHGIEVLETRIAPASLATLSGGSISVTGDQGAAGEVESLHFTVVTGVLHITDATHSITAGTGFSTVSANEVTVALSSFTGDLTVDTGTGADLLSFDSALSLPGHATLTSGGGITFSDSLTLAVNKNLTVTANGTTTGTISLATANSTLATSGTGTLSLTTARNISLATGSSLTVVDGALTLSANQQTTPTTGGFTGIAVAGGIASTGSGPILVEGRGGNSASNYGINVNAGTISGGLAGSTVTVHGTGGTGAVANERGVTITGAAGAITSLGGDVIVIGQGGGGGTGSFSYGVDVRASSSITAGGSGSVTVTGTGGSGSGAIHLGVHVLTGGQITSSGGDVNVTGTGGTGGGAGVDANGGTITAGGTGSVTVLGTGTGAGAASHGVFLTSSAGSTITSGGGNVSITGVASPGAGASDLTAQAGATLGGGGSGTLIIHADSISLDTSGSPATVNAGTNAVTLQPRTPGTLIDLGGADSAGTLGLTDAELDRITASTLSIGDTNSGTLTVSAAITHSNNLSLTTGEGVTFNNAVTMAVNKDFTVSALGTSDGTINLASTNADLTASGTGAISLTTVRDIALASGASITSANGSIGLSANQQLTPTSGSFTGVFVNAGLIHATGSGLITVQGKGGDGTAVAQNGVQVAFGGSISGGTSGTVLIQGTGGVPNVNAVNFGVIVDEIGSTITSLGANVSVTGLGGYGVTAISDGTITSGGAGTVTVVGTGVGDNSLGLYVAISGQITSGGAGSVSLTGTGGSGTNTVGVYLADGTIASGGGAIGVTGLGSANNFAVHIDNSGTIASGSNAPITITADSLDLVIGSINSGLGTTALLPRTSGTLIDLGGLDVLSGSPLTLGLTAAELGQITAATLQIGQASSGAITLSQPIATAGALSLTTGAGVSGDGDITSLGTSDFTIVANGDINLAGAISLGGNGLLTLAPGAGHNVSLISPDNDFGHTVAVPSAASVSLRDDSGFDLGPVNVSVLLSIQSSGAVTQSAPLTGTGGLTKLGAGTLTLSQGNTYTGTTTLAAGTLEVDAHGGLPSTPLVLGGGTLDFNTASAESSVASVALTVSSTVHVGAGTLVAWAGNVAGVGKTLTKTGPGLLSHESDGTTFTVSNIAVTAGAIICVNPGGLGTAAIDVAAGAALWVETTGNQAATLPNAITLHGGAGESVAAAGFNPVTGAIAHHSGGDLVTFTGAIHFVGDFDNTINTAGGDVQFAGILSGGGTITKLGAYALTLANKKNTFGFDGNVIAVTEGTLIAGSDGALGESTAELLFNGGNFQATPGFSTGRTVTHTMDVNFDIVAGAMSLLGTVSGPGVITQTGAGTLAFGTGFTGDTMISPATGPVTVGTSKVSLTGDGSAVITIVSDGMGGKKIEMIELSNTTPTTAIVIKGPSTPGGTLVVEHITSTDPAPEIASITLQKGVVLGDGIADNIPDINIAGKIGKLVVDTIAPNTIIRLGYGLSYNHVGDETMPDSYNNHPDVAIKTILGDGVIIDVTGDGTPAGMGGGGLGKVVIDSWLGAGTIRTTQSIASFTLKNGDCRVVFEVDKLHNGAATTADIGKMTITKGAWGSSGSEIEGTIGAFSGLAFLEGASIKAANILKFSIKKGAFAGTVTLSKADDPAVGNFAVNGDFTGVVNAAEAIKNVVVKGDFRGSLTAKAITSISAYSFDGTALNDGFGDPGHLNIITTEGSLGTLRASAGGIRNYDISVATIFNGTSVTKVAPTAVAPAFGLENVTVTAGAINLISSAYPVTNARFTADTTLGTVSTVALQASYFVAGTNITMVKTGDLFNTTIDAGGALGTVTTGALSDAHFFAGSTIGAVVTGSELNSSFIAGGSIKSLTSGNITHSMILAGASLGLDRTLGGDGDNADAFASATIGAIKITGSLTEGSFLGAGVNPVDTIFGNPGDLVLGGIASKIAAITISGTMSADSHLTAGLFSPKPKIGGVVINPATDARFTVG